MPASGLAAAADHAHQRVQIRRRGTARSPPREDHAPKTVVAAPMPRARADGGAGEAPTCAASAARNGDLPQRTRSQRVMAPFSWRGSGCPDAFGRCRRNFSRVYRFTEGAGRRADRGAVLQASEGCRRRAPMAQLQVGGDQRAERRGEDTHAGGALAAEDSRGLRRLHGRAPRADPAHRPRAALAPPLPGS